MALVCSVIADVTNSILLHLVYLHDSPMSVEMKRFGVSAVDLYICVCVCEMDRGSTGIKKLMSA